MGEIWTAYIIREFNFFFVFMLFLPSFSPKKTSGSWWTSFRVWLVVWQGRLRTWFMVLQIINRLWSICATQSRPHVIMWTSMDTKQSLVQLAAFKLLLVDGAWRVKNIWLQLESRVEELIMCTPGLCPVLETSIRYHPLVVHTPALLYYRVQDSLDQHEPIPVCLAQFKIAEHIVVHGQVVAGEGVVRTGWISFLFASERELWEIRWDFLMLLIMSSF